MGLSVRDAFVVWCLSSMTGDINLHTVIQHLAKGHNRDNNCLQVNEIKGHIWPHIVWTFELPHELFHSCLHCYSVMLSTHNSDWHMALNTDSDQQNCATHTHTWWITPPDSPPSHTHTCHTHPTDYNTSIQPSHLSSAPPSATSHLPLHPPQTHLTLTT